MELQEAKENKLLEYCLKYNKVAELGRSGTWLTTTIKIDRVKKRLLLEGDFQSISPDGHSFWIDKLCYTFSNVKVERG